MGTLSRYIAARTTLMCTGALATLTTLVVASVFLGNMGTFAEHSTPASVVLRFILYSVPQILYWVIPFSVCVGVVAAQAAFARHVETIAMQACTVSFRRMCVPYVLVATAAVVLMGVMSFDVYPLAQREADRIEQVLIKKRGVEGSFTVHGGRFKVGPEIYLVRYADVVHGVMRDVRCYSLAGGAISTVRRADMVRWTGDGWVSDDMEVLELSRGAIVSKRGKYSLPLRHRPEDLAVAQPSAEVLTLSELLEYRKSLARESIRSLSLDTQIHNRVSFTMAPLVMTLLVLPFGLRFPRAGGIARGITLGIVTGLVYWSAHSAMVGAGMAGYVHPVPAAWSVNVAALFASALIMKHRRFSYG
ncbi:MAG TPA: LptF/LptG family permease [Deltaproteobacteria bacterium]|nr:LptF/LptG family permease [Deltaproteobacteria bacterium]HOM29801.1 LptF/LptG family permease [Deltaproteobacteria bacterium]HPP79717.1 LptF/LptG family permease [Deltaproteobacteria bacterium]